LNNTVVLYFLASFLLIWLMAFTVYFVKKWRQKKTLIQLQEDWGKPTINERNFDLI